MLPVRHPRSWRVIGTLLIIAAFVVCLIPGREVPDLGISDKWEHSILHASLAIWFGGLYPRSRYWIIALALFSMGVVIEVAQGAMHLGRTADVRDVVANSIGIVIGIGLSLAGLGGWAQWIDGWTRGRETARSD